MFYSFFSGINGVCNDVATWVNREARTQGEFSTMLSKNNKTYVQWSCKSHDPKQKI